MTEGNGVTPSSNPVPRTSLRTNRKRRVRGQEGFEERVIESSARSVYLGLVKTCVQDTGHVCCTLNLCMNFGNSDCVITDTKHPPGNHPHREKSKFLDNPVNPCYP